MKEKIKRIKLMFKKVIKGMYYVYNGKVTLCMILPVYILIYTPLKPVQNRILHLK